MSSCFVIVNFLGEYFQICFAYLDFSSQVDCVNSGKGKCVNMLVILPAGITVINHPMTSTNNHLSMEYM